MTSDVGKQLLCRSQLKISGTVQGVGFRPYVYRLAKSLNLGGWVANTAAGVLIEIEGGPEALASFLRELDPGKPPLARIESIAVTTIDPIGEHEFDIRVSGAPGRSSILIPPDTATCLECFAETTSASNRRFGYPFTNCTNCGPRFTIIEDLPYDRPLTTMANFEMCALCAREYADPADRRFHAQPNACPVCGPHLEIQSDENRTDTQDDHIVLLELRRRLADGEIVALKSLGGFHLACDARNADAVSRLRRRKKRPHKPFALMARDPAVVETICETSGSDGSLMSSAMSPIVILSQREGHGLPDEIAGPVNTFGVMLPYTPLHYLLMNDDDDAPTHDLLVMTSGNRSDEPIVIDNDESITTLGEIADTIVVHDRGIRTRSDDSIARTFDGVPRVLRRSRGYVPDPIDLGGETPSILACGAELKNTFCLTRGSQAILSQHIGDLGTWEAEKWYRETIDHYERIFAISPKVIAHDLHPDYRATRYALSRDAETRIGVQHHHAHVASCMAENGLNERVIGVAFDGTGYGTDGAVWGGEFLVADRRDFERRGHLSYVALAGGDAAVREPWRMALAHLREVLGDRAKGHRSLEGIEEEQRRVVDEMIARGTGTVMTSSAGRLFDAVASIVGLRHRVSYEAQAAVELEAAAGTVEGRVYPYRVVEDRTLILDTRPLIEAILDDCDRAVPVREISAGFHRTMAEMIADVCSRLNRATGITKVCLSGGVFQNWRLLTEASEALKRFDLQPVLHQRVPPNDGGISLGQAAVAAARRKEI